MRPTGPARTVLGIALASAATACGDTAEEAAEQARMISAALEAAETEALAVLEVVADSAEATFEGLSGLSRDTRYQLRQFLNPDQVDAARRLGIDPPADTAEVRALVAEARLVELEDSTRYWVTRPLTHSFPYVTDDAYAMLEELGRRFHGRLDELGLPRFRFEITSALRTAELQADLRGVNPNASRTTSSHEYGTTVDIAYRDFSAPADVRPHVPVAVPDTLRPTPAERRRTLARLDSAAVERLDSLGRTHAPKLKGILGTVLEEMQVEGTTRPLHERSQPVFHTTVAEPLAEGR